MNPETRNIIEAIIFTAEQPVRKSFLMEVLGADQDEKGENDSKDDSQEAPRLEIKEEELNTILEELIRKYQSDQYPFEIREVAEGYQFFSKRAYYFFIKKATITKNQKRLSRSALETLAIIAYRQPITKAEMEFIRGVNCDYAVQKLLDKQLVSITGRAEAPGRPLLYATSPFFMQYFGIKDASELPKLKEFEELAEDHLEQFKLHQAQKVAENAPETEAKQGSLLEGSEGGETKTPQTVSDPVGQEETPERTPTERSGEETPDPSDSGLE